MRGRKSNIKIQHVYLIIRLRCQVFYEQIVIDAQHIRGRLVSLFQRQRNDSNPINNILIVSTDKRIKNKI